jgi:putative transposase
MPRKRRIVVPGEIHHVMARGIDGKDIFKDDEDRQKFLDIFGSVLKKLKCRCYAWALLPNHYHLLLRPSDSGLGILMRRLNTSYARYYNTKYKRRGYLFQDRYKSIATQEMFYFKELIRYIHLNPVRAGLVRSIKKLREYSWCGHCDVIGQSRFTWFQKEEVLRRFDKIRQNAVCEYLSFLGSDENSESILKSGSGRQKEPGDERVVGDPEFVRKALNNEVDLKNDRRYLKGKGISIETVATVVAKRFKAQGTFMELSGRDNDRSHARDVTAYFSRHRLGETLNEISRCFGVTPSAVSYMIERGARIVERMKLNSLI